MAKKFGKFFTLAVAAGTAAAAAYYVQNKKKEAALAGAGFDADDFDDDDLSFDDPDFSDSDFDDDDFVDESDPSSSYTASNPDSKVFTSGQMNRVTLMSLWTSMPLRIKLLNSAAPS